MYQVTQESAEKARNILTAKIAQGRQSAMTLLQRIETDVPQDAIVRARALNFRTNGKVEVILGGETLGVHDHALGQMANRAGVPSTYLRDLATGDEQWQRDLAGRILGEHFGHDTGKYLTRSVRGEIRGFLSDRYRRLDSRPLVEAFAAECERVGAVPIDGTCSDTRVALKAIVPQIYEPVPGEVIAFGVEWANSDYGSGTHSLRAFLVRVWCLNGATMENALAQVHLGRQIGDSIELSQRTYHLDTKTSISALRDVVRGTLAAPKIEAYCDGIRSAAEKKIDWKGVKGAVGQRLLKGELEAVKSAFEGPDVYNLPAGNTTWRASNALSWIAGQTENADRKLTLERLAGEVVSGKRDVEASA